jgi:hypothetical protein
MADGRLNRHVLNNYQQGDIIGDGPILGLIDMTAQTVGIMLGITFQREQKAAWGPGPAARREKNPSSSFGDRSDAGPP